VSSNSFGKLFTVTTFGESHGPAIGCVIDGCPPGLALDAAEFAHDLQRRATGKSRHTSARREADEVEILSGVYEGLTTGAPIALLIRNTDQRSKDYANIGQQFRPGHADYSYWHKYGIRDPRGGGRSSARETTMRVAAGVVAKKWLAERFGVTVRGYLSQLGEITPRAFDWSAVEDNPFFWPDAAQVPELETYMDALRRSGDSVGARVDVVADNVPPGWGEPIYGKLDGEQEHQRGEGRGDRRRLCQCRAEGHRASRPADPAGVRQQPCRRHPGRYFNRAAGDGVDRAQAHVQPAPARCFAGQRRQCHRSGDHRPA